MDTWPRLVLWAAFISYAFVPALLVAGWKRSAFLAAAAFAWSLTGPVMAWLSFERIQDAAARPAVVVEAIAATVTPPFFAIFGVILAAAGWLPYRTYFWLAVVALVAIISRAATSSVARPNLVLRRVHAVTAVPLAMFLIAHVANHLAAVDSLDAHVRVQNALRLIYRSGVVEPVLVIAAVSQVVTGALLAWRSRGFRFTRLRGLQFLSGAYLSMFFFSHLNAVFVFGRYLQGADTTFAWATGGRGGLLEAPASAQLLPYYFLSVVAFFVHIACAGRRVVIPLTGDRVADRTAWTVGIAGCLVALALLAPLTGFRFR